jgi:predicted nucleotidyltransferase
MDRKKGLSNQWYPVTGLTAYEQAQKIDNLLKNIEHICSEVDSEKHYFGMLKELAGEMTQRHGKFGER